MKINQVNYQKTIINRNEVSLAQAAQTNSNNKIDIKSLKVLRVLALSMVILRHAFAPFSGIWRLDVVYETNAYIKIIGEYISTISMPLFVFLSGSLFSYLKNSLKKYPTYCVLIQKKVKRLIRPYIVLAPLYILFFMKSETLCGFLFRFWKGAGHLWFLLMIFFVFLIFYPFEAYFKKYIIKGSFLVLGFYGLFLIFWHANLYPVARALKYVPFFYVGYMFVYNNDKIMCFLNNKLLGLVFLHSVLFLLTYLIVPYYFEGTGISHRFKIVTFIPMGVLSSSCLFIRFSKIKSLNSKKMNDLIDNINDSSYYIYIVHQPLLIMFFKLKFLAEWQSSFVISLAFAFVFLTSLILSDLIMRFKMGRMLIGTN